MRMYPVRGRGEAGLRAKAVFICVYHGLGGGGTGNCCVSAGGRHGQPTARDTQNRGFGEAVTVANPLQIALEAGRRLGDHKDRPHPDIPKDNLLYVSLGNW
jgi:hypothetical protein